MNILSPFTHPQGVPNLYDFISSAEHKRIFFCLLLCPGEERNSYRFGTTWWWV